MAKKKKKPHDPGQSGVPNPQRADKGDYFELTILTPPYAPPIYRAVQRAPLTAPEARERALDDYNEYGARKKKPASTALDRALEECEVQALYRFVVATMVGEGRMRLQVDEVGTLPIWIKSDPYNRLPFNDRERREIGLRKRIFQSLSLRSQADVEIFTDQIMPRENGIKISPIDWGKIITNSSDPRVARGGYVGYIRKLAQNINEMYIILELEDFRKTIGSKPYNRKRIKLYA
jgi:hypothetical protein